MLVTGIKSMPVYRALQFDRSGHTHLAVACGAGAEALLRLAAQASRAGSAASACELLYAPAASADLAEGVRAAWPGATIAASGNALLAALAHALARQPMGLRFYAAGDEDFLAQASRSAEQHGLDPDEMQCEHVAPAAARRVYCIHCHTCNAAVSGSLAPCAGCGRTLLVRDHYSRRLAAFMGVMADAETPGAA